MLYNTYIYTCFSIKKIQDFGDSAWRGTANPLRNLSFKLT